MTGQPGARRARLSLSHGQPEKETPFEDEQAQAPKALEGEPPQEAYVAEVRRAPRAPLTCTAKFFTTRPAFAGRVFYFLEVGTIGFDLRADIGVRPICSRKSKWP
jgi:hypothetical protein